MLKGQWLKKLGFDIGDYVSITCENGKLVSTPDMERAAIAEAKAAVYAQEVAVTFGCHSQKDHCSDRIDTDRLYILAFFCSICILIK